MIRTRLQGETPFFPNMLNNGNVEVCLKEDVDKVIVKKDAEIAELKDHNENYRVDNKNMLHKIMKQDLEIRKLKRARWLARAKRYKMCEFIAREEGNLSNQMSWSKILRERTYKQWVGQLLRIANLANKLQNKCLKKAEEYK